MTSPSPAAAPDRLAAPSGSSGQRATTTSSTATRVLGLLIVVGTVLLAWLGLSATSPDTELAETVRLLYVHVPMPTNTYLACFLCALGSGMYLWKRSSWWDLVAASSAELGLVFATLTIVTGGLWGKATWGAYWVWQDARLVTTLMLLLMIAGYLALRRTSTDPEVSARRSAVVGLLLVPNVIVVNRSVEWWDTLHQKSTLVRPDPQIAGLQLFALFLGLVVGLLVFAWLLVHRFRLAWLESQAADVGIDEAVRLRRAEARQGEGAEARQGEGAEARQGEGAEARQGEGAEARQGEGTPDPVGGAS